MPTRNEVFDAISAERDYQDKLWGARNMFDDVPDDKKRIADWVVYMEFHLDEAKRKLYYLSNEDALAHIRKMTALGVRCLELHGCPQRKSKEGLTNVGK